MKTITQKQDLELTGPEKNLLDEMVKVAYDEFQSWEDKPEFDSLYRKLGLTFDRWAL